MRKAGVADSVTRRIAGHSSREMFDRYNTADKEALRKAEAQMGIFLANVDYRVDLKAIFRLKVEMRFLGKLLRNKGGAEGGTRTPTSLSPLDPEPSASANSATSAT